MRSPKAYWGKGKAEEPEKTALSGQGMCHCLADGKQTHFQPLNKQAETEHHKKSTKKDFSHLR
jgi:hypothetical protein